MALGSLLRFPIERIRQSGGWITHSSLGNRTFYKPEEVDAPCLEDGTSYGEWKLRVGLVYLSAGKVPRDILFLMASSPSLENSFLERVESEHGRSSEKYRMISEELREIHNNRF